MLQILLKFNFSSGLITNFQMTQLVFFFLMIYLLTIDNVFCRSTTWDYKWSLLAQVNWSVRTLAPRNLFLARFVVYSAFLLGRFKLVRSCQSGRTQWALGPGRSAEEKRRAEIFTPKRLVNPCADESLGLTVMTTTTWWSQSYINLSLQPAAFRCACVCWHRDRCFPPEGTEECVNWKGNRFCLLVR